MNSFLYCYDLLLKELLNSPKRAINYLNPQIQNEVLQKLENEVNFQIMQKIGDAVFMTIVADSTQDLSKIDQLSTVFRYASYSKDEHGNLVGIEIKESFVGFTEVNSQALAALEDTLLQVIADFIDLPKLRGQGYDGPANMSGVYTGLQVGLSNKNPYARYIHCCAHDLNSVFND